MVKHIWMTNIQHDRHAENFRGFECATLYRIAEFYAEISLQSLSSGWLSVNKQKTSKLILKSFRFVLLDHRQQHVSFQLAMR